MTLILHCLTPEYIVNVSDRRLTLPNGDLFDDTANKSIILYGNAILAYTGLAVIDHLQTDEWITSHLIGAADTSSAISKLQIALNDRIWRQPTPYKRLTISISYFGSYGADTTKRAHVLVLTNSLNPKTLRHEKIRRQSFICFTRFLPDDKAYAVVELGREVPVSIRKRLSRNILNAHKNKDVSAPSMSPDSLVKCMRETFREASRCDKRIGDNLMVSLLPNWEVSEAAAMGIACGYLAGRDKRPRIYLPTIVDENMAMAGYMISRDPVDFRRWQRRKTT